MNSNDSYNDPEPEPQFPPPERKQKRKLSLKAAMALATNAPGHESLMPLIRKDDETLANCTQTQEKIKAYLLGLQADVINREELLEQREKQLDARENDLNKHEALLDTKMKNLEASISHSPVSTENGVSQTGDSEQSAQKPANTACYTHHLAGGIQDAAYRFEPVFWHSRHRSHNAHLAFGIH